ncbi:uncharacterized protein At5g19025 [Diospyros lotus]|uniref:uncharacterized protein At5g19025 n=1 Tax=Diospyros lotus TaxID=55363 RepID=UPI002253CCE9|nr:uncharacterized protein At5g19025 [Diospyros lotus]
MVCFNSTISIDRQVVMAKSVKSTEPSPKLRNKRAPNLPNRSTVPACHRSRSAAIDVMILIAVIGACGFLLFPYIKLLVFNSFEIIQTMVLAVREEISAAPMIYGCLGLNIACVMIAATAITVCMSRKCGKPGCRGLHKAAEFDIQLETEECVKNSGGVMKDCVKKGLFELPRDHHRELEGELKKMAPPNGRAVLVYRARCGCSVGRMEVPGPKKHRKVKK